MTNDLISRDALAEKFKKAKNYAQSDLLRIILGDVVDTIEEAPAVDAAPVVHGRWENIANYGCGNCYGYCSECKSEVRAENATALIAANKYCPNCGARMDKEAVNAQE